MGKVEMIGFFNKGKKRISKRFGELCVLRQWQKLLRRKILTSQTLAPAV
jgi:hypothetical protein